MKVYLVFEDMGYDGVSLLDAKVIANKDNAIAYQQQLQQDSPWDVVIEEMEVE